jgi:hypothetical protein
VKCDEEKPFCRRCIKAGFCCEGYKLRPGRKATSQRPAVLMPKSTKILLSAAPSSSRFKNEDEARYFDIFSTNTAYEIFPSIEMGRLRLMFLQACETEASLLHAVIALGALDKTSQTSRQDSREPPRSNSTAGQHYYHALKAYTKAIHYAQVAGKKDLRTALLTSLAILSFEAWYGRHDMALQQIKIGTSLMKEWNEQYLYSNSPCSSVGPQDVKTVLSPVFARLSVQLLSSAGDQCPESPPPLSDHDEPESGFQNMPTSFSTLEEAGTFRDAIMKRLLKFISKAQSPVPKSAPETARSYPAYVFSSPILPSILAEKELLTQTVEEWLAAFEPLKKRLNPNVIEDKKAAIALELQIRAVYMSVVTACAQNEMIYDSYTSYHTAMVNLCEMQLNTSPSPSPNTTPKTTSPPKFSFDIGVIIYLWSIGHKCRSPLLRRRAISLLLSHPRREGLWDSVFAARLCQSVMEFEEQFITEEGYVPEWARIRCAIFKVDLESHSVELECLQGGLGGEERGQVRRKRFECFFRMGGGVGDWEGKGRCAVAQVYGQGQTCRSHRPALYGN